MLSPEIIFMAAIVLVALAIGAVAYIVLIPYLSGANKQEKRIKSLKNPKAKNGSGGENTTANRRKKVEDTINELDARAQAQKDAKKKVTMRTRLLRAGSEMDPKWFYVISALIFPIVTAAVFILSGVKIYIAAGAGFAAAVGLPRFILSFKAKRRQKKFLAEFPNSIDIIVRGVKTGLPVFDCIRIIANEASEPLKGEFNELVEQQKLGVPLGKGLERMYDRIPLTEVNFLSIVVTIQQQSGGNLAETLQNLSTVLRERKKLHGKIQAFSQEAKSSAAIIGALPLCVMLLVYITTPHYISLLWTEQMGHYMLAGSAIWMLMGVLVMRKMINFDY